MTETPSAASDASEATAGSASVASRDDLRDLVIREMQKTAARDERFRAVVEPLGFFTVMDLMDGIVDAVLAGLPAGER